VVIAACLVGLAIRLTYVFTVQYHVRFLGDAFYYHYGANLLADGKGFIQPYDFLLRNKTNQAADHPPLYILVLSLGSLLGGRSFTAHQVLSCFVGTSTIAMMAVTARRIISPSAGIVTAIIVAGYPNFWLNDGTVLSEGLAQTTTALTVLLAYALWRKPSVKRGCWLGAAIALAALTRAEAILLPLLIVVPLVLGFKQLPWKRRLSLMIASWAATGVVLAPWVGYNLSRFDRPVYISSGFAPALLSGSCDAAWFGSFRGYWSFGCVVNTPRTYEDISRQDQIYGKIATTYIKKHLRQLPAVELAKIGRLWNWYKPSQTLVLDHVVETRPVAATRWGIILLYSFQIATIPGIMIFRRRRIPLSPLIALFIDVTLSAMISFGQTRYRAAAEVGLVLFAVAGFDGLREHFATKLARRRAPPAPPPASPPADHAVA
jgi:4-amino-4-deoxy-L-arabinose transferase-like glycosyltransferase